MNEDKSAQVPADAAHDAGRIEVVPGSCVILPFKQADADAAHADVGGAHGELETYTGDETYDETCGDDRLTAGIATFIVDVDEDGRPIMPKWTPRDHPDDYESFDDYLAAGDPD